MNSTKAFERNDGLEGRCQVCPLNRVQAGVAVRIKRLCVSSETQARLREIGFREEQVVRLLTARTSPICLVCNTRLAISEQLARLILVEPIAPERTIGPTPA